VKQLAYNSCVGVPLMGIIIPLSCQEEKIEAGHEWLPEDPTAKIGSLPGAPWPKAESGPSIDGKCRSVATLRVLLLLEHT